MEEVVDFVPSKIQCVFIPTNFGREEFAVEFTFSA
jgi:hypothetical protein